MRTKQKVVMQKTLIAKFIILLLVPLLFWTCKRDEIENSVVEETGLIFNDLRIEQKSLRSVKDNNILEKINNLKHQRKNQATNSRGLNDGFTIDTTSITVFSKLDGSAVSYRFDVYLDNPIQNTLMFLTIEKDNINNTIFAKLSKAIYDDRVNLDSNEITLERIETELLDASTEELNTLTSRSEIVCHDEMTLVAHQCTAGGDHWPGENCVASEGSPKAAYYTLETFTHCDYVQSYGGDNSSTIVTNGIGLNVPENLSIGGFSSETAFSEFMTTMGWSGYSDTKSIWWLNSENSLVVGLLANLYEHNVSISNSLVDQLIANNFNNTSFSNSTYWDMNNFLMNNNYSDEACQAVLDMIKAMSSPDRVYFKGWENYPCQKQIIGKAQNAGKALQRTSSIASAFQSLFGYSADLNIVFENGSDVELTPLNSTEPLDANVFNQHISKNAIYIVFRRHFLSHATDLSIAQVTFHEMLHAILYAIEIKVTEDNSYTFVNTPITANSTLTKLLDNYTEYISTTSSGINTQHQVMSTIVDELADALKTYSINTQSNILSNEQYKDLAWKGLTGTNSFRNKYPIINPNTGFLNSEYERITFRIAAEERNLTQTDSNGNTYEPQGNAPNPNAPCN